MMNYYNYYVEIKNRGILFFITTTSVIFAVYQYKEVLLFIICSSVTFSFIHTSVTEVFYIYIKLIYFVTNQICLIYCFFHVISFLTPGLYNSERRAVLTFLCISTFTFIFAIIALNFVLLPLSFEFFLSFQNVTIFKSLNFYFEAKIEDYFYFYVVLYHTCQLYCQLFAFLISFFFYYGSGLEEVRLSRKLFYFFFCCLFFSAGLFSDVFLQTCFCLSTIFAFEFIVFYLFFKKVWDSLLKKR